MSKREEKLAYKREYNRKNKEYLNKRQRLVRKIRIHEDPEYAAHLNWLARESYKNRMKDPEYAERRYQIQKKYRAENKERSRQRYAEYVKSPEFVERRRQYLKKYRENHREELRARDREAYRRKRGQNA